MQLGGFAVPGRHTRYLCTTRRGGHRSRSRVGLCFVLMRRVLYARCVCHRPRVFVCVSCRVWCRSMRQARYSGRAQNGRGATAVHAELCSLWRRAALEAHPSVALDRPTRPPAARAARARRAALGSCQQSHKTAGRGAAAANKRRMHTSHAHTRLGARGTRARATKAGAARRALARSPVAAPLALLVKATGQSDAHTPGPKTPTALERHGGMKWHGAGCRRARLSARRPAPRRPAPPARAR